jgi:hypothetical protein
VILGVVCPKGHRVGRKPDGRIWCGGCRQHYADRQLVEVPKGLRKRQSSAYALGYSHGYERGAEDALELRGVERTDP